MNRAADHQLIEPVQAGDEMAVAQAVVDGADPIASVSRYQGSVLIEAARSGRLGVVGLLVDAGARIGLFGYFHVTPLRVALLEAHADVVQYLIAHGALPAEIHDKDERLDGGRVLYTAPSSTSGPCHAAGAAGSGGNTTPRRGGASDHRGDAICRTSGSACSAGPARRHRVGCVRRTSTRWRWATTPPHRPSWCCWSTPVGPATTGRTAGGLRWPLPAGVPDPDGRLPGPGPVPATPDVDTGRRAAGGRLRAGRGDRRPARAPAPPPEVAGRPAAGPTDGHSSLTKCTSAWPGTGNASDRPRSR